MSEYTLSYGFGHIKGLNKPTFLVFNPDGHQRMVVTFALFHLYFKGRPLPGRVGSEQIGTLLNRYFCIATRQGQDEN